MKQQEFASLMTFWRDVEALSPQKLPKVAPGDKTEPVIDWAPGVTAPWSDPEFAQRRIPADRAWRYTVYAEIYDNDRFIELLEKKLGKEEELVDDRGSGNACVFAVAVGENGVPVPESLMLCMGAWAFGVIVAEGLAALPRANADTRDLHEPAVPLTAPGSGSGFAGFDLLLDALRNELAWRVGNLPEKTAIDRAWLDDFARLVIAKCKLASLVCDPPKHYVRGYQAFRPASAKGESGGDQDKQAEKPKEKSEDDILNSFFIKDLNRLIATDAKDTGKALQDYLDPPAAQPIDVRRDRDHALKLLAPEKFPLGSWPSEHPLVWSQQVAVNSLWGDLHGGRGTFAVNGPPGTGKTTLLRDVVAAIIVARAQVLADDNPRKALPQKQTVEIGGEEKAYYPYVSDLQGFSIVVASCNNGAVENVTLELPKEDAIHSTWAGQSNFYPGLAGKLIKQPAWALIAGRLGKKENRNQFADILWWLQGKDSDVQGMRNHLNAINKGKAKPALSWMEAIKRFRARVVAEDLARKKVITAAAEFANLGEAERKKAAADHKLAEAVAANQRLSGQIAVQTQTLDLADSKLRVASNDLAKIVKQRPNFFLSWLLTGGESRRKWRPGFDMASAIHDAQLAARNAADVVLQEFKLQHADVVNQLPSLQAEAVRLAADLKEAEAKVAPIRKTVGEHWPAPSMGEEDQEKASPWSTPEWRETRIQLFLAALNLHRAFIEANEYHMRLNLDLAFQVLKGGVSDGNLRRFAFDTIALLCPVISTTFASVGTLFGDMPAESIGWLLIDEAGQAAPQQAAGAIFRARRAIIVGDPLQLEPVVTLPRPLELSLAAQHGGVAKRLHPSLTSVQVLADQATQIGTYVGEDEKAKWVGAPLRVHRRCETPMFTISNKIAYDGMMVHRKTPSKVPWPKSCWIDVPASGPTPTNNWIPAEGMSLEQLLADLIHKFGVPQHDIFLISPFTQVVQRLIPIGKTAGLDWKKVGTVHTTQGKEAEVVIMVLGGRGAGARDWVASAPNLLNVAASRAKTRFYVIGDYEDWKGRPHFAVLAKELDAMSVLPEPEPAITPA